jgi:hypothetical protein
VAFQAFGQALLPGAGQISPDKNLICRRAGSCFTCEAVWNGFVVWCPLASSHRPCSTFLFVTSRRW